MKRRSFWFASSALSMLLLSCSASQPITRSAISQDKPRVAAEKPTKPVDEPLAPPIDSTDEPVIAVSPVIAARPSAPPDEPLTAPAETRWGSAPAPVEAKGSMWGDGGLGLSGIGEGGGGRGEGIGLGTVGTLGHGAGAGTGSGFGSGHGRLGGMPKAVRMGGTGGGSGAQSPAGVRTGEWDDNANFREFGRWLVTEKTRGASSIDISVRRFVVVRDAAGKPVPSCSVDVRDSLGKTKTFTTTSSGRALLFPRAEGFRGDDMTATANLERCSV
jgi:hypothetical protein